MVAAIKQTVTVGPGGVVQVTSPELQPGTRAEVIVLVQSVDQKSEPSADEAPLTSFIGSGKGSFSSIEEADAFIRNERDAWDR
jgi:hypothetical protein